MNVLQVNPTNVYPPSDGGQHRSHGLVSAFPEHGDAVYRYCQGGHLSNYLSVAWKRTEQIADDYCEFQHLHPLFDLARSPELFSLPNVFLGHSLRIVRPSRLLNRIDWADLVLVELPWQVPAVATLAGDTPVVYSSHNVEAERFESATDSAVETWFTDRVVTLERAALERADLVVCTSNRDVDEFRRRFDVDFDSYVAPNGVSEIATTTADETADGTDIRERHGIKADTVALFVGTDYGPNREAAAAVLRMAAEARTRGIDVHFLIVGSVCESLSEGPANVTLAGFVPDLAPYHDVADVGLNPIASGSGTNIKVLEYLQHGLAVVTTDFGARGFDISHGTEALVVPEGEFVTQIARLQRDPSLRDTLEANGTAYIRQNHHWQTISSELRRTLAEYV